MKKLLLILFLFTLGSFGSVCDAGWVPPDSLVGTWTGTAKISSSLRSMDYPGKNPDDLVAISFQFFEDGRVEGTVGGAQLVDCKVKKNRGWLGRKLKIKTDFLITGGTLDGKIIPPDNEPVRNFALPFSLDAGGFVGSVMVLKNWKYPFPLVQYFSLNKEAVSLEGNTPPASSK